MNFLAHIYLSGDNDELKIGNFIGDFVKSSDLDSYSFTIQRGIQMHWAIDAYTDQHLIVQKSKDRLREKYRHYAAVIVDIYYDHFLALNWSEYHPLPFRQYVNQQYDMLFKNMGKLPNRAAQMLPFMMEYDWLYNYQYFEGIERVMQGMANRSSFNSQMEQSVVELKKHHKDFENEFKEFFIELRYFCNDFLDSK